MSETKFYRNGGAMAEPRHLANAPITEAVIDFRVKLSPSFHAEEFLSLEKELPEHYPTFKRLQEFRQTIELKEKTVTESMTKLRGVRLESGDGRKVVQFRIDGFTFSRLKPYTRWEEVFAEAMDVWSLYKAKASPELVTRLAVRYINHMKLPLPIIELSDYLTAAPRLPESLPQEISNVLTRMVVHVPEIAAFVNITEALEHSVGQDYITLLLDIDAFKRVEIEVDSENIPITLEQLRHLKNRFFFGLITEKTARSYE